MTTKGRNRELNDPNNRIVATFKGDEDVEYQFVGNIEKLINKPRNWRITAIVAVGGQAELDRFKGHHLTTEVYETDNKVDYKDAATATHRQVKKDLGNVKVATHIDLIMTIKQPKT